MVDNFEPICPREIRPLLRRGLVISGVLLLHVAGLIAMVIGYLRGLCENDCGSADPYAVPIALAAVGVLAILAGALSGRWFVFVCGCIAITSGAATIWWSLHAKATCDIGSCGYVPAAYIVLPIAGGALLAFAAIVWPRLLSAARRAPGRARAQPRCRPPGP